ncbi:MAG: alpha-hydroxy-acid oxidizing protein [bacterium]|nr:alpha-hydroxy-acid oxidizing protein [bacterium]
MELDSRYPSVEHLRARGRRRTPAFAFDYLDNGCHDNLNMRRNTDELREVRLEPRYVLDYAGADLSTELFGERYAAPFGIAPIGLQGLIWPHATEILAAAAHAADIPFVLSTVTTASIERVAELTAGRAWFQLYHPVEDALRDKLLDRSREAGVPVLVLLADTPTFGYRPKEIRNGLAIPPRMSLRNIMQMVLHPTWSLSQLRHGVPEFATIKPYIPAGMNLEHLGKFMNTTFDGRLTADRIAAIRDRWPGKLVVKGIVNPEDCATVADLGVDGIIVSNHGGRQLEVGTSTIQALPRLVEEFGSRLEVLFDSGVRTGPDVACALASGARFTFLGRAFMYGVCALGRRGGAQVIEILRRQLTQVLEQLGCAEVGELPRHLVRSEAVDRQATARGVASRTRRA